MMLKSGTKRLVFTVLIVGTILSGASIGVSAAGFYNESDYEILFTFVPDNCPWILRWACSNVETLRAKTGHWSSGDRAGTLEMGGSDVSPVREPNGRFYRLSSYRNVELGNQDWVVFKVDKSRKKLIVEVFREGTNTKSGASFEQTIVGL